MALFEMTYELDFETSDVHFDTEFENYQSGGGTDIYEGSYVITATSERQVLPTARKLMTDDMVIEPIPSNYGRIDWNGSILTVS